MIRKFKNRQLPKGIYLEDGKVWIRIFPKGKKFLQCFGDANVPSNINVAIAKLNEYREAIRNERFGLEQRAKRIKFEDSIPIFTHHYGDTYRYQIPGLLKFFSGLYWDDINYIKTSKFRPFRKSEISDSTVNRELTALSVIYYKLKSLVQFKEIEPIKLPETSPLIGPDGKIEWFDERLARRKRVLGQYGDDEFQVFMKVAHPEVQKVCLAALNTALRRKDLFGITGLNAIGQGVLEGVQAKTGNPYTVPNNDNTLALFRDSDGTGTLLDDTGFRERFEASRDLFLREYPEGEYEKRYFQFRDLRRTALMKVWEKTKNILLCMELAGHTNVKTTQLYLGLTNQDIKEAGKVLQEAFTFQIQTAGKIAGSEDQQNSLSVVNG